MTDTAEVLDDGSSGLEDFDAQSSEAPINLEDRVTEFIEEILPLLSEDQLRELTEELLSLGVVKQSDEDEIVYDAQFDLGKEIELQLRTVHALRRKVMINNRLRSGATTKEVKDVVSTTTTMLNALMKHHEKMLSMDRQRALESATISVLKELGDEAMINKFFELMERALQDQ